jgi:branched-chain amino acid transport system permease protein
MNVKNLAQGDFVISGGYVSWWLVQHGFPALLGVPMAFVVMWGIGWVVYKLVISRVIERDLFTSLLATFGLAIMMAQILNLMFGSDTQSVDLGYATLHFADGLIDLPIAKLIGVLMAAALATGVIIFMKSSRMGQAIRATAQDARAARVMGIDTEKVYAFTFSLNSGICGAAGAIIVMVWLIQPFYGISYSIRAFVIVTAAGLGNLPGVIAAGLGIGAAEQYGAHIFGIGYQQAIAVLLLLVVLLFRLIQQRRNRQVLK